MKKNQKTFRLITCAVAVCICGMCFSSAAYAALTDASVSWYARYVNATNAPADANHTDHILINQMASGATAICNSVSHSNPDAYTGETYIACENFEMTVVIIQNTGTAQCWPNIGQPVQNISIQYRVSAYTPTYNDIYTCEGVIYKNP